MHANPVLRLPPWARFITLAVASTQGRWGSPLLAAIGLGVSLIHAHAAGVKAGPFEIEFRHERRLGSLPNGDPFKSHQIARYRVLHGGRVVAFNPGGVEPTKRKWLADDLLEAHVVYSKGSPVVLVCTETGTYVLSDRDGKPVVTQLNDQPATRFQFLDSVAGQPGELQALNAGPDEAVMGRDLGRDGTLMSLHDEQNINFGVLDLGTLEVRGSTLLKRHRFVYNDPEFGGYSYDASPQGQVRVWWKDRRQFALVRARHVDDTTAYALEVVNLDDDSFQIVPFDLNRTRLVALGDVSPAWVAHYFDWRADTAVPQNAPRLVPRSAVTPLPWQGSTNSDPYGGPAYNLQPVLPEMRTVLLQFLTERFGATPDGPTPGSSSTRLTIGQQSFTLDHATSSKSLTLKPPFGTPDTLTPQIADQFNRLIRAPRYQALFTTLGPGGFAR